MQFLFHAGGAENWLAIDESIGRQVALNVLRSTRESERKRFFVDVQITCQLEHCGIVPLYDLGIDEVGQHFCVKKFVRARPLKEAIAECHKVKRSTGSPSQLAFRRLLQVFVDVCHVIAFAHHNGVLHRDMNPDNIMLEEFGGTLVVNWGSAMRVSQSDEARDSGLRHSGKVVSSATDRALVGSPPSIAPKDVKECSDGIDEASDIYSLGATLYEILTGRPPRQGSSSGELIDLAVHARPTPPRKVHSRIPRPLEAMCLKAMSYDKQDRYQTPLALAEDIERYLAGQPTIAYREPLLTRALRWVRCRWTRL